MGPYSSAEPTAIISDEVELRAIEWLAARKSRLTTSVSVVIMALTAMAGLLAWPLAMELQFAVFHGPASVTLAAVLAFALPMVPAFLASVALGRLLVRVRARAWLATAARQFGMPADELPWVIVGSLDRR